MGFFRGNLRNLSFAILAALFLLGSGAKADDSVYLHKWRSSGENTRIGSASALNGASVSAPIARRTQEGSQGPANYAEFDLNLPSLSPDIECQVTSASLYRCTLISNPKDRERKSVGLFGNQEGDAISFPKLPDGTGITIFYTNDTDGMKQCSLYVGESDVATIHFEDTIGRLGAAASVYARVKINGPLMLRVDADDLAGNKAASAIILCANIERIVVGPPRAEIILPFRPRQLDAARAYARWNELQFQCRAPQGLVYSVALADQAGNLYTSRSTTQTLGDQWEPVEIPFYDFKPAVDAEFVQSKIADVRLVFMNDGITSNPVSGKVSVGAFAFAQEYLEWPSTPPENSPFEHSKEIRGMVFTGRHARYVAADTWYPSWASDGNMYSSFTDGRVRGVSSCSAYPWQTSGNAVIRGDNPLRLEVESLGVVFGETKPYSGRYPSGNLVYNGVWYYGTYALGYKGANLLKGLGPFVGFRYSEDYGKTWTTPTLNTANNLFGETAIDNHPIEIGTPHFVDFGKNMEHSPDGYAYLTAHGSTTASVQTWIGGNHINLLRVKPSPQTINDPKAYEFFGGYRTGTQEPIWTSKFEEMQSLFRWNCAGCVTMTYDAPLHKYLMCVSWGANQFAKFDTYILESDNITGPWNLVTYMKEFGPQAYFVNIPSKFISQDGRTLWLCYSDNYVNGLPACPIYESNPPGAGYGLCLQEVKLQVKD